jgi:hypothetical protein
MAGVEGRGQTTQVLLGIFFSCQTYLPLRPVSVRNSLCNESIVVWAQGFTLEPDLQSFFALLVFQIGSSIFAWGWPQIAPLLPVFSHSWDYRHEPPYLPCLWKRGVLSNFLPGLTLILSSPDFCLLSCLDYWYVPPCLARRLFLEARRDVYISVISPDTQMFFHISLYLL